MNIVTFDEFVSLFIITNEYMWFECLSCKCLNCKNIQLAKFNNSCKCGRGHDMNFVINNVGKILICA